MPLANSLKLLEKLLNEEDFKNLTYTLDELKTNIESFAVPSILLDNEEDTIKLEWSAIDIYAEVVIHSDSKREWFIRFRKEDLHFGSSEPESGPLNERLIYAVSAISFIQKAFASNK